MTIRKIAENSQTHREHIGDNIRRLRIYRGLTQTGLAEKVGIAPARISDYEAGKENITLDTLVSIASALNCVIDIGFTPVKGKSLK